MRPVSFRRRFPVMAPAALAVAALLLVCASVLVAVDPPLALAESAPLSISIDKSLSQIGGSITLTISGQVSQSLAGSKLVVSLRGPVAAAQVGQSKVDASVVKEITRWLGTAPAETQSGTSTATTVSASGSSTAKDLAEGKLNTSVVIPSGTPSAPGAYLVSVEVRSGGTVLANGRAWLGKVAARSTQLDVAFVLPVSLGIHRDWAGKFFDQALERATLPVESGADTLRGLVPLVDRLSTWRLTMAVEPVLLTQLRDMSDGYIFGDSAGSQTEIGENDLAAQNAVSAVSDLAGLASRESVEMVATPYTGADLGLLAAEGWRDGLEQIQMGKQELQSTLGLNAPIAGAYAPDLSITGGSLAYYADASVDHVVVGSDLQGALSEPIAPSAVAVRAENAANDRVTLVFASSGVASVMRAPWDSDVFSAALAADLASRAPTALVIAPKDVFGLLPMEYVQRIGEILTSQSWIRTLKLQELVSQHSPDSRPILLDGTSARPAGYIEDQLLGSVREAHSPVSDLAAAADTNKTPVNQACQLLYLAESRWWSREGVSPTEASMGLAFAEQARAAAQEELGKVRFLKADSPLITGGEGTVHIAIENSTDYQVAATLKLAGEGLSFLDGNQLVVELQPGRTDLQVNITSIGGPQQVTGSLLVGTTLVDELVHDVRSVGLWEILPWVLAVLVLLGAGAAYVLVKKHRRKGRADEAE
jgi:hypothetical protein